MKKQERLKVAHKLLDDGGRTAKTPAYREALLAAGIDKMPCYNTLLSDLREAKRTHWLSPDDAKNKETSAAHLMAIVETSGNENAVIGAVNALAKLRGWNEEINAYLSPQGQNFVDILDGEPNGTDR